MKVAIINSVSGSGSTGRICEAIATRAVSQGCEAKVFYGLGKSDFGNAIKISNKFDYLLHNVLSRLFDGEGFFSFVNTCRLIHKLKQYCPDIIHIHNLHGHYINFILLFKYISKEKNCRVIITLHDCWAFTGHCAHFEILNCNQWKKGCYDCAYKKAYPKSIISRSKRNYNLKKKLIACLDSRLYLVPVSYWMESFISSSMYKSIRYSVIHNGIDLSVFRYISDHNYLANYGIKGQYVLGVAHPWSSYKGLDDVLKLRESLNSSILIVLVGLSREQIACMPCGIVGIAPTKRINDLVSLYSSAIALINTTYCDNYPTVNLESIACGTPVITYNTGGSPESLTHETGVVVPKGDISGIVEAINSYLVQDRNCIRRNCITYAQSHFNQEMCFMKYIELYSSL